MSNLDYLIPALQLEIGDIDGTKYAEDIYRRALVSAVKFLSTRWYAKYYIDSSCDIQRNADIAFAAESPPIILASDEYAIVLAAAIILYRLSLTSSVDSFVNWSTPDLSVSTGSRERTLSTLYSSAIERLDLYFKTKLAAPQKSTFPVVLDTFAPNLISRVVTDVPGSGNG